MVYLTLVATGPGITRAQPKLARHGSNREFAQQKSDGKDFFFEQYGGNGANV